ncbi:unnamed protein product [Brachionus calyciflorus]|uniref:Uncharacterized protein n=1 Tax=Brachionus calyciflorus TaxID=104777 RepID=A0A814GN03_9BILA|nr:unnamed protein product [Brachionus calyciflorus]
MTNYWIELTNPKSSSEHKLELYPECRFFINKNGRQNSDLVNELIGTYINHSENVLLKRFIVDAIKVDENVVRLWEYIKEKGTMKNFQVHYNPIKNFKLPSTIIEIDVKNESQNSQTINNTKMIKKNNPFFTKDNFLNIEGTINYFIKSKKLIIKNFELDDHLLFYKETIY